MADSAIVLEVQIQAAKGQEQAFLNRFRQLLAPSRQEPGCLEYQFHTDPEDNSKFFVYEKFANQAALEAHLQMPHFKSFALFVEQEKPIAAQTVRKWKVVVAE